MARAPPAQGSVVKFVPVRWEDVSVAAAAMLAIGIPFVAFTILVLSIFIYAAASCWTMVCSRR